MIFEDFESILPPEPNGKRYPNESYTNEYKKICSYGYKLVCVDNKFSKLFKSHFVEDVAYNSINSVIQES